MSMPNNSKLDWQRFTPSDQMPSPQQRSKKRPERGNFKCCATYEVTFSSLYANPSCA